MELADIEKLLSPLTDSLTAIAGRIDKVEAGLGSVTTLTETVAQIKGKVAPEGPPDELTTVKTQLAELTTQLTQTQAAAAAEKQSAIRAQGEAAVLSALSAKKVLHPDAAKVLLMQTGELAQTATGWTLGAKPLDTALTEFLGSEVGKHLLPPATGGDGAKPPSTSSSGKTLDLRALL